MEAQLVGDSANVYALPCQHQLRCEVLGCGELGVELYHLVHRLLPAIRANAEVLVAVFCRRGLACAANIWCGPVAPCVQASTVSQKPRHCLRLLALSAGIRVARNFLAALSRARRKGSSNSGFNTACLSSMIQQSASCVQRPNGRKRRSSRVMELIAPAHLSGPKGTPSPVPRVTS